MHIHAFTAEELSRLLARADELALSAKARERLEWLTHYVRAGRSVSATCRHFGITRVTFYRLLQRFNLAEPRTLEDQSRRPHGAQSPVSPEAVALIRNYRLRFPQMGKETVASLLLEEHGMVLPTSAVGRVIVREGLYFGATPLHLKKRHELGIRPQEAASVLPHPALQAAESVAHHAADGCPHCTASRYDWSMLKRALVLGSILSNIAIIVLLLLTAVFESGRMSASVQTNPSAPGQASISSVPLP